MNDVMEWISLFFVMSGVVSAIIIACDLPQHKQMMKIMNVVWVLTGLWASYLALWAYFSFGRGKHTVINNYNKPGEDYNPTSDMQMDRDPKRQDKGMPKANQQLEVKEMDPNMKMDPTMPNMKMSDMDMKEMKMPMHDNSDTMADSNKSMSNSINTTQEEANKMDPNMKMDPAMPNMKMGDMDMKEMKMPMHDNSDTMADSNKSMSNSINTTQEEANKMDPNMKMDPAMPNMKMGDMDMKEMKIPMHDNSDTMADSNKSMSNSINTTQEEANKMDPNMKMDPAMPDMKMDGMDMSMSMKHKKWQSIALSAFHCGAGCTLADLIGEWFTVWVPIQIGGSLIAGQWVFDFCLALVIGVFFQFFAIRQMEKISAGKAFGKAIKADFFSLTSWQVGMYVWMSIVFFAIFKGLEYQKDTWTFWFMMQVAMLIGFFFAYPTNALLIKLGIKKGM